MRFSPLGKLVPHRCSLSETMLYCYPSRPAGDWYNVLESDYFDILQYYLFSKS